MTGAGSARLSFARRGEERHRRASDHCAWCAESGRSQGESRGLDSAPRPARCNVSPRGPIRRRSYNPWIGATTSFSTP